MRDHPPRRCIPEKDSAAEACRVSEDDCACAQEHHPGHGPQYLWNASVGGKTKARNLPLGPELEKVQKEVERYRKFDRLCQELVMSTSRSVNCARRESSPMRMNWNS